MALVPVVALAVVAGLSACGQTGDTSGRSATIIGGITYAGGAVGPVSQGDSRVAGGTHRREPGRVVVRDASGHVVAVERVRRGDRFRFRVDPGQHQLVAQTDHMRCRRRVHTATGSITRADLICSIP